MSSVMEKKMSDVITVEVTKCPPPEVVEIETEILKLMKSYTS